MRIAIASDDGTTVAAHAGRCQGFAVYDVEGQSAVRVEYRPNSFTAHAQGNCHGQHAAGAGHHTHGPLVDALADCRMFITRGIGPRLVADLSARGIESCICAVDSADEAARLFAKGQLVRTANRCSCGH